MLDSPDLPPNLRNGRGFRAILHQLGTMGDDEAVRQILRSTPLNEAMTKAVWEVCMITKLPPVSSAYVVAMLI